MLASALISARLRALLVPTDNSRFGPRWPSLKLAKVEAGGKVWVARAASSRRCINFIANSARKLTAFPYKTGDFLSQTLRRIADFVKFFAAVFPKGFGAGKVCLGFRT